ncbi:DUF3883 domain-containing protein [Pedobacter nanyangensis]|uniref:DUF3883 domain-containing protein n=1 Tax=Pedobacter nanyangensis TaxID=1562389 RepID=UPI000DE3AC6F|nr:DUF3883 domain-containing protein [Pedobacter nanyangensis]
MTTELLRQHQMVFLNHFDNDRITSIEELLKIFYSEFPIDNIKRLSKENYVLGRLYVDQSESFCYWMEKKLENFGKISGSNASQYGVFYGRYGKNTEKEYRGAKKYGSDFDTAFHNLKIKISELLLSGSIEDYAAISRSIIPDKFKGKLLATYFPDKYLSIYSKEYLDEILTYFNLDDEGSLNEEPIYNQLRLIKWKNEDDIMKSWSLMKFAMFINDELYTYLYNVTKDNEQEKVPKFPEIGNLNISLITNLQIDKDFINTGSKSNVSDLPLKKQDYEKFNLRKKAIGDRGEHIAKIWEEMYLIKNGRPDLAKKVTWVSRDTDSLGYDILSWGLDGRKKYIEVKSTTNKKADPNFFITSFELSQSESLTNYFIYYVFDVLGLSPKIWNLGNPFFPKVRGVVMKPTLYKVSIKSKKV